MVRRVSPDWPTLLAVALLLGAVPRVGLLAAGARMDVVFCCQRDNDLYRVLAADGVAYPRYASAGQAIAAAPRGGGVLLLADGYPRRTTPLSSPLLDAAAAKELRVYVEFPAWLPDQPVGEPRGIRWERAVVTSGFLGPSLAPRRILAIHGCRFVPTTATAPHLVLGRVAGVDTAVFGLPKETFPVLFEHPRGDLMVATTKLSHFVTARYGPADAWQALWRKLLAWLTRRERALELAWTPSVRPSYSRAGRLPKDIELEAFRRGAAWFRNARLLIHPSWKGKPGFRDPSQRPGVAPGPPRGWPVGDGKLGLLEGPSSTIHVDGSQPIRWSLRNDCMGEAAMAFAFEGVIERSAGSQLVASNLLDFIYFGSPLAQGPRADPKSPSFGLVGWTTDARARNVYYGDDNARSMLGAMAVAALLGADRWDEPLLRCLLANLRTTGPYGFRAACLNDAALQRHGWRHYYLTPRAFYAPHYEAYLWACFLWAYRHTGYEPFLVRAKTALRMTMAAYPGQWRWTNGIQQERARILLPLAWLVRVEDTPEHRQWLRRMAGEMLADQVACGARREELGPPGHGSLRPPVSNDEYGRREISLIQETGDPIADLLYTTNFAFLGLHEAAAATADRFYADAEDHLADFLCRIQIRSDAHPELDGGWFRAFDFRRWDYWASNGDAGWGAWCIESGWTQGWIVAVLGLRHLGTSLWDLTADSRVKSHFRELHMLLLPEGEPRLPATHVKHLAIGRPVKLAARYDSRYTAGGPGALVDGIEATGSHPNPAWQGYWQVDLDATIDLGKPTPIRAIRSCYLQQTAVGIFLPKKVTYALSTDGKSFRTAATLTHDVPAKRPGPLIREFASRLTGTRARYVRVHAASLGTIPSWHAAGGQKAWLFVDEIVVE